MKRPTKADILIFQRFMSEWVTPAQCSDRVESFMRAHGNFARGLRGGKLWRETFHAVKFADAVSASHLKTGQDPPDFEFLIDGTAVEVELVVSRDLDDQTSAQFIEAANLAGPRPVERIGQQQLDESWRNLPHRIARAVKSKADKRYSKTFHLAVAASSWWWDGEEEAMEGLILQACRPYLRQFARIWILAGGHFMSFGSNSCDEEK